jgi:RNA methyltransferase, TrmH family
VQDGSLIPRFGRARRDPTLAVLEGLHPLKHALRFGADVIEAYTDDPSELARLCARLAPDVARTIAEITRPIGRTAFDELAPLAPSTRVMALARRPRIDLDAVLANAAPAPVVLLENPRDLGNMGACVRVCAAADAAAVITTGSHDPWHPDALRAAAGLHFALPVTRIDSAACVPSGGRPTIALDPAGEPLDPAGLDPRSLLAFGTERHGLSRELLGMADARVRIPMRPGVSSLNLATSVAAALFGWRLAMRAVSSRFPEA